MDNFGLCYWLSDEQKEDIDNFESIPDEIPMQIAMLKKITKECDIYNPISKSTGWRTSDIDVLSNATDPRLINAITARLNKPSEPNHSGISDQNLLENCIPNGLNFSNVDTLAKSYQRVIDDVRAAQTAAAAPASAPPIAFLIINLKSAIGIRNPITLE